MVVTRKTSKFRWMFNADKTEHLTTYSYTRTIMTFAKTGLPPQLLSILEALGYLQPTPIQGRAIPLILTGKDAMAAAQTGTGKTAAFALPILAKLIGRDRASPSQVRSLILAPTRELASQIGDSVRNYSQGLGLRSQIIYGGVKAHPQINGLKRGTDILVATPWTSTGLI